ncbi:hypothetical protein SAMN05216464_108281 [Mucilaginibacter pineti]|uniref:Uncharacterized protein n=1 Tax=Mucilaginibacter pineti TaxID=1391627 RepID=A0A1G7F3S3_9SPHI|nr:hypothetical protein [Mucilaginibacter pineti]SDE70551.1 hypothetical protein SAMN05216464_108281 [Mucilaginibacter pineti]
MIDVENLKQYQIKRPDRWSLFGDAEDFDNLPVSHKDQIFFLDKTATDFLYEFLKVAKLIATNDNPFSKNNFKTVEHYTQMDNENGLKKWLYNRAIPFKEEVFLLGDDCILTTWKIVVKYAPDLFFSNDTVVFNSTLNWCLFYFHHDHLFFGRDNIYDTSNDQIKMDEINRLKGIYPNMKFPY